MSTAAAKPTETQKPATPPTPQPNPGGAAPGGKAESSFLARMTGKKEAPKKPEEPPKPDDKKPAADAGATPPAPGAKPQEPPKPVASKKRTPAAAPMPLPPPEVDVETIATTAATAAVAAIKGAEKDAAKPGAGAKKEDDLSDGLDDDEKETIQVLSRMESDFGDAYKGLPKRYADSLKKAKKYQSDWEAAHPGQKFDAEDDEHNAFFEENEVDWKDMDFNRALARIENDRVAAKDKAKEDREKAELTAKNRLHEERPVIEKRRRETAKTLFTALGDDYKAVINEDGSVNGAEVKRLIEEDPLREITFDAASRTEQFAEDLHLLYKGLVKYDEKNANHEFIAKFVESQEQALRALPAEQQLNERGQRFATAQEYAKMTPARQQYYWRFTDTDIAELYAEHEASHAKKAIEEEEKRVMKAAERRGLKKVEALKSPEGQQPEGAGQPPQPVEKPVSPEGTIAPREAQPSGGGAGGGKNATKDFLSRWIGK